METQGHLADTSSSQKTNATQLVFGILSLAQREIFDAVNFAFICTLIGIFGIVANVINIIIFFYQGFSNTVNISFFGLAISDLCCLLTMEWVCICLNPLVARADVPWVPGEFQYMTGAWLHVVFARISCFITVYVTAERCLCLHAPLKIKEIITPTRTAIIISFIYVINIAIIIPEYVISYLDRKFIPERNKTLLAIRYTSNSKYFQGVIFYLAATTGMMSFISIIAFTVILTVKLKKTSEWRKEASSSTDQNRHISGRDKKTMKMVIFIAIILIVCFIPSTVISMVTCFEPEFYITRSDKHIFIAMWSFAFVFQATNSSVNIFLYYFMSMNYRQTFLELFGSCKSSFSGFCFRQQK